MKAEEIVTAGLGTLASHETPATHETIIEPNQAWLRVNWAQLWEYRDLLMLPVHREFASKYKQTVLGPAWFIVNPLMTSVVCETDGLGITPGRCNVNLDLIHGYQLADRITYAAYFDVEADDFHGTGKLSKREWTMTVMKHRWKSTCETAAVNGEAPSP